jgi:hypothetical protein
MTIPKALAEKFLTKYALSKTVCKCGRDVWVFLLRSQPHMVNIDMTDHECAKPAKPTIAEIKRAPGGNGV